MRKTSAQSETYHAEYCDPQRINEILSTLLEHLVKAQMLKRKRDGIENLVIPFNLGKVLSSRINQRVLGWLQQL